MIFLFGLLLGISLYPNHVAFLNPRSSEYEVMLEENEDNVITGITSITMNEDETKIIINNNYETSSTIYDLASGKIIKTIPPKIDYADSLIAKFTYPNPKYEFVKMYELVNEAKEPMPMEMKEQYLKCSYTDSQFLNDSIILFLAKIPCFIKAFGEKFDDKNYGLSSSAAIIRYNMTNDSNSMDPIQCQLNAMPQCVSLKYLKDNKIFIITSTDYYSELHCKFDSLLILAYFDERLNYIKPAVYLPKEYADKRLAYNGFNDPLLTQNNNDNIIVVFPLVEAIFNITKNSTIQLTNLHKSNNDVFKSLQDDTSKLSNSEATVYSQFVNLIKSVSITASGNYLVEIHHNYDEERNKITVQEYSSKGKMLKQKEIDETGAADQIKFISYSKKRDKMMIFRKSNQKGWSISFVNW